MAIINFPASDRSIDLQQLRSCIDAGVRAAFENMTSADVAEMIRDPFEDFALQNAA